MAQHKRGVIEALGRWLTSAPLQARVQRLEIDDQGHGFDAFGLQRDGVRFALGLTRPLYDVWFRVSSHGHEHIPASGAAILAANHSGTLPFDAMMLWVDVARHTDPPRIVRTVADHFVPNLPVISTLFARAGAVGGSRGNMRRLLERGELVGVFPEGVPGIGKHFRERYNLQAWRVGHVELALRHRAPVVPVAVVGAEEQMPQVGRIPVGSKLFGAPYLPVTLTPIPLPVHYHISYGPPLWLHELLDGGRAGDPEVLERGAALVKERVEDLIAQGLRERPGVFR